MTPISRKSLTEDQLASDMYLGLLGRDADPQGLESYSALIRTEGPVAALRGMISSPEFQARVLRLWDVRGDEFVSVSLTEFQLTLTVPKFDRTVGPLLQAGEYEPHVTRVFSDLLAKRTDGLVLDVGSNVGVFSSIASARGRAVVAIEANPINAYLTKLNAVRNGTPDSSVLVLPYAAGEVAGQVALGLADGSNSAVDLSSDGPPPGSFWVACARIDSLVKDRVAVMKIDIEGYEMPALVGATAMLARSKPAIFLEYGGAFAPSSRGSGRAALFDFLSGLGYNFCILSLGGQGDPVDLRALESALAEEIQVGGTHLDLLLLPGSTI